MTDNLGLTRGVSLSFLGENIPALGPRFQKKEEAVKVARQYIKRINEVTGGARRAPVQISLGRQQDGRYFLILQTAGKTMERLNNIDELLIKRFRKGLKKTSLS
ncbi:MAG: hypothetical protein C4589_08310 [Peptococcaceae bacterium]|nr:MAG: hypothetical protein C4589_08310 [Peptococcaceae bacterium]